MIECESAFYCKTPKHAVGKHGRYTLGKKNVELHENIR